MTAITRDTTREEFAAIVAEQLRRDDIDVVLVGGSVAAIYSSETYVTYDLDFVHWSRLPAIATSLAALGFTMKGRLASHPESDFTLDFVNSPVVIGHKYISDELLATRSTNHGISPLDCVLDRLSAFYHFGDRQGLEQAVEIARRQNVSIDEVARWSQEEGRRQKGNASSFDDRLQEFLRMLEAATPEHR
jgi:hypothetical protein